jgi:hypothetical protein
MIKCRGCLTSIIARSHTQTKKCVIKNNAPKKKCPCQKCLVKTTCGNQCEEFEATVKSIFNFKLSYDYKAIIDPPLYGLERQRGVFIRPYYKRLIDS